MVYKKQYVTWLVLSVLAVILIAVYQRAFPVSERSSEGVAPNAAVEQVSPSTAEDFAGTDSERRIADPDTPGEVTPSTGKLKADTFSGTLESVDTGCFADGECFVVVDGKHVTAIMGWSRDTVGAVQGVEGFGDLESHIGEQVEVYAQDKGDGTYTLYGSEGFYIKLAAPSAALDIEVQ